MTPADPSPWTDGALARLHDLRPAIADLSARAEAAVLHPRDPGGWSAAWRAETAARICDMNGQPARAAALRQMAAAAGPDASPLPADRDAAARRFADKVAGDPRAVTADDIVTLRDAGVPEADIVRLCELVAFVSYQCRVEAGMALLEGSR